MKALRRVLIISIILSLCFVMGCKKENNESSDFKEENEDFYLVLSACKTYYTISALLNDSITDIVIPSSFNGIPITKIDANFFKYLNNKNSCILPNTIISIATPTSLETDDFKYNVYENGLYLGTKSNPYYALITSKNGSIWTSTIHSDTKVISDRAFSGNSLMSKIHIPEGVKSVGYEAFFGCRNLSNISIPNSLEYVDVTSFRNINSKCYNKEGELSYIGNETNPYLILVAITNPTEVCIVNNKTKFIMTGSNANTTTKEVIIPDSVIAIGDYSFSYWKRLEKVTMGKNVNYIGYKAFSNCSNLSTIELPDKIKEINSRTFENSGISEINIPSNVVYIGDYAFSESDIETITFESNSKLYKIYSYAFYNCNNLRNIKLPNSLVEIGIDAFYLCSELNFNEYDNALYLGKGSNDYYFLIKAKEKTISTCDVNKNTKAIVGEAFDSCYNLTTVNLPDGIEYIGELAFNGCKSLKNITLPNSITEIRLRAFAECSELEYINIPEKLTVISNALFLKCSKLKEINLPKGITEIGAQAFECCSNLTKINIPDKVKYIRMYAFAECISLTKIVIPKRVKMIEEYAFVNCNNLTIYCEVESEPYAWAGAVNSLWNFSDCPVVWGYSGE